MNNLYLFDIDGTLSQKGIIPESAKESLKMLQRHGDYVLLATGRCMGQMTEILKEISVDGLILCNGGYAVLKGEVFSNHPISKEAILRLEKNHEHVAFLSNYGYYRYEDHPIFKEFADYWHGPAPELLQEKRDEDVYSLGVYSYDSDYLPLELYPELHFVRVAPLGYDVVDCKVSKGTAVQELRQRMPGSTVYAFGDNYNDMEMLEAADISIVMAHAPEAVKQIATYVTKDVLEDGIQYALKEILHYED